MIPKTKGPASPARPPPPAPFHRSHSTTPICQSPLPFPRFRQPQCVLGGMYRAWRVAHPTLLVQWLVFLGRPLSTGSPRSTHPALPSASAQTNDQSPAQKHSVKRHLHPCNAGNLPNMNSHAGFSCLKPSNTSRSRAHSSSPWHHVLHPDFRGSRPWLSPSPAHLAHCPSSSAQRYSQPISISPNPAPFLTLSRKRSMQARASSSGSCPPLPSLWISQ